MAEDQDRVSDLKSVKVLGSSRSGGKFFVHLELGGVESKFELEAEAPVWEGFSILARVTVPADLGSDHAEAGVVLRWVPALSPRLGF